MMSGIASVVLSRLSCCMRPSAVAIDSLIRLSGTSPLASIVLISAALGTRKCTSGRRGCSGWAARAWLKRLVSSAVLISWRSRARYRETAWLPLERCNASTACGPCDAAGAGA